MKLFKHSSGMILSFGFDVQIGAERPKWLCWSGREGNTWIPGQRDSDKQAFDFDLAPEFIHELTDGRIIAYQPGRCIEITPRPDAAVFSIRILTPDQV